MPVYDFTCAECGDFREFLSIDQRNEPTACPSCDRIGRRVIRAPNLALMNPNMRKAHGINEKSRHEPRTSQSHTCGGGCGCGTKIRPARMKDTKLGQLQTQKASARPWMLGH